MLLSISTMHRAGDLTSYSYVLAINEVRQPFDTSIAGATLLAGLLGYMAVFSSE